GVVKDLSRNGIQVEPGLKPPDSPKIERQEVKEEGTVGFRSQRDHLALRLVGRLVIHDLQIGGLSTKAGTVVDDFAIDFARREVNETQCSASVEGHAFVSEPGVSPECEPGHDETRRTGTRTANAGDNLSDFIPQSSATQNSLWRSPPRAATAEPIGTPEMQPSPERAAADSTLPSHRS